MYEQLPIQFEVPSLLSELGNLQQQLGDPLMQSPAFGGYCLQSQSGDWHDGFEFAYSYRRGTAGGNETGLSPHHYYKRTNACTGYFGEVLDTLEEKGLHPRRARVSVVMPGAEMSWHQDASDDAYCIRLHIAIQTNLLAEYQTEKDGVIHIPADGRAWLVDTGLMHRSVNYGDTERWHFFAEIWDTVGHSENFVVSESRKSIKSFYDMKGHETYMKVIDEQG